VVGERYQGVTLGISVPLWRNSQRLQQAKMQAEASEMHAANMRQEFYDAFRALYQQAQDLQQLILDYHASMRLYDDPELLEKALDLGNISIMDYISEKGLYYGRITKVLEAERDYELLYAELTYVEL
ncbi:MAG TPA: TolC family protein, partial [Dysgonamonadaceae bacterium]|nr:TolC family protein [Dysgonamonadaceae bacterium]